MSKYVVHETSVVNDRKQMNEMNKTKQSKSSLMKPFESNTENIRKIGRKTRTTDFFLLLLDPAI
jgi:hypothetical protein